AGGETTKISPFAEEIIPENDYQKDLVYSRTSLYENFEPEKLVSSARSMEPLIHLKMRELLNINNAAVQDTAKYPELNTWIRLYQMTRRQDRTGTSSRSKASLTDDNRSAPTSHDTAAA